MPTVAAVAVLIKTCDAHSSTRLPALLTAWAANAAHMRAFATDAPITVEGVLANETVVMGDLEYHPDSPARGERLSWTERAQQRARQQQQQFGEHEYIGWLSEVVLLREAALVREAAFVPHWRDGAEAKTTPAAAAQRNDKRREIPPALTRRVARGLEVLYDAFAPVADWYLIADDDTFIRLEPLRAYLATLDSSQMMMVGSPVPSFGFLTRLGEKREGAWQASQHCAGPAWAISRAAMAALRPRMAECLASRNIKMSWYYDEVALGHCLYSLFGLTCQPLPGVHFLFKDGTMDVGTGAASQPSSQPIAARPDDDDLLSQHPALPRDMARLSAKFDAAADKAWIRRMRADKQRRARLEPPAPNSSWQQALFSPPGLVCVLLGAIALHRYNYDDEG